MNKNHLKPLIKWSGGKCDEIVCYKKYFPKKYKLYLEPFVGGGSTFFYVNPLNAVISDVHNELITFYNEIKDGSRMKIYDFMKNNKNDEITYYKVRDEMKLESTLDIANRFYYLRKTCFRGMLRYNKEGKFNIPFGKYKKINFECMQDPLYENLLKHTEILNKDFSWVFKHYDDSNNFMFLDPPYDSTFTDYGYCKFGHKEHIKLANCFKKTKIKCLMVIGKTDFISNLYKDYIVEEYDKKYKFKIYAGRIGKEINNKHLIIKNY
jgi:DNA adenine methylase